MCGRHRGNREGRRVSMRQYEMFELSLSGEQPSGSYVAADLSAEFVHRQTGEKVSVTYDLSD